jgi:hypothetical protein
VISPFVGLLTIAVWRQPACQVLFVGFKLATRWLVIDPFDIGQEDVSMSAYSQIAGPKYKIKLDLGVFAISADH